MSAQTQSVPAQLRILHVTLSFSNGGRREAIAALCAGLADDGFHNYLCCLEQFEASADERMPWFVDCVELRRRRLLDFAALRRLRQFCEHNRIDILHAHDAASEFTCALAMPGPGTPLLMSFHRSLDFESARPRDKLRNALVGLRAAAVVTASEERRQHYMRQNHASARKVVRIPLGINLARFHPDPTARKTLGERLQVADDTLLVGVVGHFGPEKGVDIAVDAYQLMCRTHPHIKADLVVLGSGSPERVAHMHRLIDPGFGDRVHMVGFQARSQEWMCAFDVLLHAARNEAFGLVLVEAMACAVPVIAPAVGGIPDIVLDRECGRLVAKPDAELLACALAELLADADERARMAQGALHRATTEFGQQRYARRFASLYMNLVGKRPPVD